MEEQLIESLPNTSPLTIRRFRSLGIKTYWDLINYFPYRYEDYSLISKINQLQEGEVVTVIGQIADSKYQMTRTGLRIQKFALQDETGTMELNWYNQPYLLTLLKKGTTVSVAGGVKRFGRKIVMDPKEYEIIDVGTDRDLSLLKHTGRIIPIYPEKRGLSSKTIREKMFYILTYLIRSEGIGINGGEVLPKEIVDFNSLINEEIAYHHIHFPKSLETAKAARQRLAFDELLIIQLANKLVKQEWEKEVVGNRFLINESVEKSVQSFIRELAFTLTKAQIRVIGEIREDLQKKTPMNRFLQGEVGSGKTVVATIACYLAFLNGYQSLFMAPTEILAQQHYKTISSLFNFQFSNSNLNSNLKFKILNHKCPKICLVTSSIKPLPKELQSADIIIGTHALIQKKISYDRVGLVIIDEQHRFGVSQRAMLKEKGINPHLLTMTATPIPRTVALTLYGELDLSVIDEMPIGRLPVKTYFIPKTKRPDCYQWIKSQITNNHSQVFIICPLIEESEVETMKSVKAATSEYQFLKEKIFPEYSLGLIHGKLKTKEKEAVMQDFKNKKYHILVATSVVEVGIDIANAVIILIEGGERFGLAQLHQLRGRVGRADIQSYCFLFTEKETLPIIRRLKFFSQTQNGNILAEKDLEIRGAGNIYGTKQHGIVELKIASLSNFLMIEKTRKAMEYFISKYKIKEFKGLERRVKEYRVEQIAKD